MALSFSSGGTFPEPQWMPETMGGTEPYVYYRFSYVKPTYYIHTFLLIGNTAVFLWHIRIASITTLARWGPLLCRMRAT